MHRVLVPHSFWEISNEAWRTTTQVHIVLSEAVERKGQLFVDRAKGDSFPHKSWLSSQACVVLLTESSATFALVDICPVGFHFCQNPCASIWARSSDAQPICGKRVSKGVELAVPAGARYMSSLMPAFLIASRTRWKFRPTWSTPWLSSESVKRPSRERKCCCSCQ